MSTSAENQLRFVYEVIDALKLEWRTRTTDELIQECRDYIASKQPREPWKLTILRAMQDVLMRDECRSGLELRLRAVSRQAAVHPDRAALVTELAQKALQGEMREVDDAAGAYPSIATQLDRLYEGTVTKDEVWRQEWLRVAARLNVDAGGRP